jgi:hypothetical protein
VRKLCIVSLVLVGVAVACPGVAQAQDPLDSEVYVSEMSVPYVLDVDLRTLSPVPEWQPGDPIEVVPEGLFADFPVEPELGWTDPVRQQGGPLFAGQALFSFSAHPSGNSSPPDTVGTVGPNHYISMVNSSRFAIWDKQGNNLVPPTAFGSLWSALSSCVSGSGDPIVQYDRAADRWLMQQFVISGNIFCIAISQGPDPVTSGWFLYQFSAPVFPDYPQFGVWNDAYYAGTFESPDLGIYAFDRTSMLAGAPATFQRFAISHLSGSSPRVTRILPSDAESATPPPEGSPAFFARTVHSTQDSSDPTTRIEIWEYHVDFVTPANSTFTLAQTLIPAPFALLPCSPGVRDCIPQPGTGVLLDALFNRALRNLQYRNFGTHETMVITQVVDTGGIAGKRWWELRRTPADDFELGGGWVIHQEGTYSPDSEHRFMGSVAMNGKGEIALGYSVSSDSVFPEIRVTARRPGDPAGEMTMAEITLVPGEASYTANQRWGDYTSMDVDPADDETFWFINQRVDANGQRNVWVGAFELNQEIFSDGFESSNTLAWSATVP